MYLKEFLVDAKCQQVQPCNREGWKLAKLLGLLDPLAIKWSTFINLLVNLFISLAKDDEDTLISSKNPSSSKYIAKLDCNENVEENFNKHVNWWCKFMWKNKFPLRCNIILWDIMWKHNWSGPNMCVFCFNYCENLSHLFFLSHL